ncbi:MAG TPA: hypothetical protein VE865_04245 [Bradyrhizobium sp.]|nr:hypothetical protein [Bradyrhizobium sp.]
MIGYARSQSFIVLLTTVFLVFANGLAEADPITPTTVTAGTSPTLTINSSGFFDLSKVTSSQISISPPSGVSKLQVSNATPTSAAVTFDLSSSASAGSRMLVINAGDVIASLKFTVASDRNKCTPANCRRPKVCEDNQCIVPHRCVPACRPPKVCVRDNVCELKT